VQAAQFTYQQMESYPSLLTGAELAARVTQAIGDDRDPSDVAAGVSASVVAGTYVLDVTVSDESPETARDIAEAISTQFGPFLRELNPQGPALNVSAVDTPEVPSSPTEPSPLRNIGLGLGLGLLAGVGLVALRYNVDAAVWDTTDVPRLTGMPIVGGVHKDRQLTRGRLLSRTSSSPAADDYRRLATTVRFMGDGPPQVIMISSAGDDEGATTSAIHLSLALADVGHQVILVDADLRNPRVGKQLDISAAAGLTDVLSGTVGLDEALSSHGKGGLEVLSPGSAGVDGEGALVSHAVGPLLEKIRGRSDYVVITAPRAATSAVPLALAPLADVVLLTVRYGRTQKDQLREAAAALTRVRARVGGVIMTVVPRGTPVVGADSDHPTTA
jgi:Mrp family chromosome partitioning ATPase